MTEEQIDVLDAEGMPTGEVLTNSEIHARNLWHGVAHVWIYNRKGQILLQQRHKDVKWAAGCWDLTAGGHISAGESPEQAAIRETKEELVFDVNQTELMLAGKTIDDRDGSKFGDAHRCHQWNFILKKDLKVIDLILQEGETGKVQWYDLDLLKQQ